MSAYAAAYFQKHNPAVIGLVAGIGIRAAWEYGFVTSIALVLGDIGVATRIMLNDLAAACSAFVQFAIG